ncbi:MAG: CocE/NonD family hydrolase, partial [Actinomycetota bacterium]|nr:CocE/NonD family hydrolase [Actinomycetota bacterium]
MIRARSKARRLAAVLLTVAVAGSLMLTQAPAAKADITVSGKNFDYSKNPGLSQVKYKDDEIIRDKIKVPMSAPDPDAPGGGEVMLHVEVVRPKTVKPYPTILELSPYHGTIADRSGTRVLPGPKFEGEAPHYLDSTQYNPTHKTLGLAGYFAPRGYAVVFANLRGTGKSGGCLDHLGQDDLADADDLLTWIGKQKWSNGRVGMTGHSYVAGSQSLAAAAHNPVLKTIVPSAGLGAMYHHKFQYGVPYFLQWVGPAGAYEALSIQRYFLPQLGDLFRLEESVGSTGDSFGENIDWFGCGLPDSALVSGDEFESGEYDHDAPFSWDKERDHRVGATKADIPVFAVHGVNDNAARIPALDWFHTRRGRPGDKAWIGQWNHGSGLHPNDRSCRQHVPQACPPAHDQWTHALHAWFDKHLAKRDVKTGPEAEVFLNNHTVYEAPEWPPRPPNKRLKLYPQPIGDGPFGELGTKPVTEENAGVDSYIADPRGGGGCILTAGCGPAIENEFSEPEEMGENALGWESKPFKEDVIIAGTPKLKLFESQSLERMHVITTLYDIAPDGSIVCVPISGANNPGQRCGISKATFAMNPELRGGSKVNERERVKEVKPVTPCASPAPCPPGAIMRLEMRGMAQAHFLEAGHKIRMVIASSQPDKVPTHGMGGRINIHMGGDCSDIEGPEDDCRTKLVLPIVRNATLKQDTLTTNATAPQAPT